MRISSLFCLFCLTLFGNLQAVSEVSDANFQSEIAEGVVVVEFYSPSCPHCKQFTPIFREVGGEMSSERKFLTLNVKAAPKIARKHRISRIPTVVIFQDGKEVKRRTGGGSRESLEEFIRM